MFPVYWDGDILIYCRDGADLSSCLYNECIVKLKDGRAFLKRIMPGRAAGQFDLHSYNGPIIQDVDIEWAAPVQFHDKRHRRSKLVTQSAA